MSIVGTKPPWTRGDLRRLGVALASGQRTPELLEKYDDLMLWHNALAAEVAAILFTTSWKSCSSELFDITARPKTIDTLVQKLRREHSMTLDEVQDLAGVRIDAAITLDVQTALGQEIAGHFGERSVVRDLRDRPHSGYRAVHVWLRLPAGRVEVQIRTVAQSVWANTYERLGDRFGRGIRYDEMPDDEEAYDMVRRMHVVSDVLARSEQAQLEAIEVQKELVHVRARIKALPRKVWFRHPIQLLVTKRRLRQLATRIEKADTVASSKQSKYLSELDELRSMLDKEES